MPPKKKKEPREGDRKSTRVAKIDDKSQKAKKYMEEYGLEEDKDDDMEELSFLSIKKSKRDPQADLTPVQARFSLESLVEEEATRRKIAKEIAGEVSSGEGEEENENYMRTLFGESRLAEISSIMQEATQKTTDDLDLQPFFHRWSLDLAAEFSQRLTLRLPDCLLTVLNPPREHLQSSAFVNLILKGDWIPTLFPDRCPEELARWLFSCVCYGDDVTSAAAWDAWTVYFGRSGLWDPDDASFGWFDNNGLHRAAIDWVPDWKLIVTTLGHFGAPTEPYIQGVALTSKTAGSRMVRDTPPVVDRTQRPVLPSAELSASFPSSQLRRFVSLLGLCAYASANGRLFSGGPVYSTNELSLLVQICFSCLVDPLLVTKPKREFSQCIAAAVQGYSDEYLSIINLCDYVTFAAPYNDMAPLICSLSLFSPTTARAQWLKRALSFWVSTHLLRERVRVLHSAEAKDFLLPNMQEALQSREKMLEQMCVFLQALLQSFASEKPKGQDYIWLFNLLVCLDLTLGDRTAIFSSQVHAERVSELLKQVQESFRSGEEMNEFASASRTAISLMKERINYNIKFEKNRLDSVRRLKAANAIGGGKQSELPYTPISKK